MGHLIENDSRMHKSLEEALRYKYIEYTIGLLYFPYVEEKKLSNLQILAKLQLLLNKENGSW